MDFVPIPRARLWKNRADFFRPFRVSSSSSEPTNSDNIIPLYDPALHHRTSEDLAREDGKDGKAGADLRDLNSALAALVEVFPDVQPEVFREMLVAVSEESRLLVVTEHLRRRGANVVRGRSRGFVRKAGKKDGAGAGDEGNGRERGNEATKLTDEQTFRSDGYKKAVKQVLYQEFRALSHSSIRAVLAEQNFSYTLTRPVLQQLSARGWRFSLSAIWQRKSPAAAAGEHPFIVWQAGLAAGGQALPAVKRTGNTQLDQELYDLFVVPVVNNQRKTLITDDLSLASKLNHKEASDAEALFDCECCYNSVVFEQLATCDDGCHQLCFDCVRRTVSEALFGQGWARAVHIERSTVCCFAPTADGCNGVIPGSILRRALSSDASSEELWSEFQDRAAMEAIAKTALPLQRCPFCTYVEINDTPPPIPRTTDQLLAHLQRKIYTAPTFLVIALAIFFTFLVIPIAVLGSYTYLACRTYPPAIALFNASWQRVYTRRRGLKFHCHNPTCAKTSCVRCLTAWHDIHTCFENEKTSLRTAIEASATAAVKRTCPKCLLSFVKSTGCNKLVCNCGYTMCYICRQEITSKEGYAHFCQHFRPHGGRCVECERCDLYGDEDEEAAIRKAAEAAELAWRENEGKEVEGSTDERAMQAMMDTVVGRRARPLKEWEVVVDFVIDAFMA